MSALTPQQAAQAAATAAVTAAKALTEQHSIQLTVGLAPRDTHVLVDGHDITHQVQELTLCAGADAVTTVTLELKMVNLGAPIRITGRLYVEPGAFEGIV